MEIRIPLRLTSANSYKELRNSLHQLELSVHHAQKALDAAKENGVTIGEDSFVIFGHPVLESSLEIDAKNSKSEEEKKVLENIAENYYEELQDIEIVIHLV